MEEGEEKGDQMREERKKERKREREREPKRRTCGHLCPSLSLSGPDCRSRNNAGNVLSLLAVLQLLLIFVLDHCHCSLPSTRSATCYSSNYGIWPLCSQTRTQMRAHPLAADGTSPKPFLRDSGTSRQGKKPIPSPDHPDHPQ